MKHLNFLSKSGSQSCSHRVVTLASTVGSPSAHRRGIMLRLLSVLVLVLTFGVGQMWGADASAYKQTTFNSSNNSTSIQDYTSSWSNTTSGFKVNITNANNNKNDWAYIKMGRKNTASTGTIITDAAIDKRITKVELVIDAITANNITSINLYKATSKTGTWSEIGSFAKGTGIKAVHIAAANQAANLFYKIEVVCTSGSSNGLITISGLKFYRSSFEVSYNSNGGSGTMTDSSSPYDTASVVTVKSNGFTAPNGKEFDGWKTGASSGTSYAPAATFTISANTTLYAQWKSAASSDPTLTLTGSGSFGNVDVNATKDLNFTLAGSNLTANASIGVTGTGFSLVTPAGGSLTQTAGSITGSNNITVRFAPTAGGAHNGTLTVSSTGASDASVSLSGTGQLSDTFIDELHSTTGYTSASPHVEKGSYGTTPTIADKPTATSGTCAQQHYHFVGWITAAKFEAGTSIAVGDLQSPTSATGATYYAVWAKASAGASFNGSTGGDFLIYANVSGTNKYATNTISSGGLSTTTTASDAQVYTFTKSGDDWTISYQDGNTTKYLTAPTGNNGDLSAFSTTASTWKIVTGTHGTWRIYSRSSDKNGNNTYSHRGLYYQTTANAFKNYATSNVDGTTYYDCEIGSATTYTDYKAVCCNELGQINGSVLLTKSSNSVTVKGWTYTQGSGAAESNINTYDVYLYSSADDYTTPVTQTCAYSARGTDGVTFSGLSNANTYKLKIGATGNINYCDITPVQVTTIDGSSTETFQLPCVAAGLSYGTSPVVKSFGNDDFTNALTNSHGLTVSYSVLNADPSGCVTVNGSGLVHIVSAGTATIKATSAEQTKSDVKYCEGEASYSLTVNKLNITPSVSYTSTSLTAGGTSASPTITGNTGNGGVTYSSSNTDVATVDASTGVVTAKAAGSATITASIAATTNYNAGSATANFTISAASQCATPTFSVATGTYNENKSVELGCLTEGATIYYTTDGSDPTSSGTRSSYSSAISIGVTTTIRAYAEKSGMTASEEGSATITIKCASPTFSPDEGSFTSAQNVTLATTYGDEIYYTTNGDDPATNGTKYTGAIAVSTTNTTIKAIAKKTNCANSDLATATYTIKCATPTIEPGTGDVTTGQEITLSCATEGATIYYTMGDNPADPTTASTPYDPTNKPVVSAATTIKAIAVKTGWSNSDVASATYAMKYTVTLNAGGGSLVSTEGWTANAGVWTKAQASAGGFITLPNAAPSAACGTDGWTFDGWVTEKVTSETTNEPDYVSTSYTPNANITLYAVYKRTEGSGSVEYTLVSDAASFTDGTYVVAAYIDNDSKYYFINGSTTSDGLSVEETGLAASSISNNKFPESSLPQSAIEVEVEDNGTPVEDNHYYYVSYTSGNTTYKWADQGTNKSLTWATESNIKTYHPVFTAATDGCTLISSSTARVSHNTGVTNKGSLIRCYASNTYNDIYFFKKSNPSTTYYTSSSNCAKNTLSSDVNPNKGTVTLGATQLAEGATTTASAEVTDDTYRFAYWTISGTGASLEHADGDGKSTDNPVTVTMGSANATVTAHFEAIPPHTVTWSVNGEETTKDFLEGTTYATIMTDAAKPSVADDAIKTNCGSDKFMGWATSAVDGDATYGEVEWYDEESTLTGDQTFYAVWATEGVANTFNMLSNVDNFVSGADYIIASYESSTSKDWKLKAENYNSKTYQQVATQATISDDYEEDDDKHIWKITSEGGDAVSIYNAATKKYLAIIVDGSYTSLVLQDEKATLTKSVIDEGEGYADHFEFAANSRYVTFYDSSNPYYNAHSSQDGHLYIYKRDVSYSNYRTNCCTLKPVTNVQVGTIGQTSVQLTWTAPSSKTGITKLQVVNADNEAVLKDNIDKDATSATVTGLTECTTYNMKVVSIGSDCSSSSDVVTATPFAGAKVVTFNYNGGSGATTSASTSCGEGNDKVTLPTPNDREGFNFTGWYYESEKIGDAGAKYTPSANITLVAHWAQLFTITYNLNGGTLSSAPSHDPEIAGESVELVSETPEKGFMATFTGWEVSYIDANEDKQIVDVNDGAFIMPAANVTITATYDEIVGQWILVTDESQLVANSYVIIAAANANKAIKTTQNSTSYRYITDITKSGSIIENPSNDVQIFVLREGTVDDSWAFQCLNGDYKDKYIYANSSSSNYMNSQASNDANSSWKLDFENGYATAQGDKTRNVLSFNSDRFACYGNTNQDAIAFYQFREGVFYDVNMPASAPTGGTVSANASMAKAGEAVTLTYTPSRGYTVKTLTVTGATSGDEITISPALEAGVTSYTFTMPAEAVTVAASFEAVPPVVYNLVENADELAVGMQFVMVGKKASPLTYYGANEISGSFLSATELEDVIDAVNNKASITTQEVIDFVLEGEPGKYKILYEGKELNDGGNTSVSFVTSGSEWTITNVENSEAVVIQANNKFQFNPNNPRFTTYSNGGQQPIYIYALPYTTYNFVLDGCKTIKVVTGYTYTYTIKNSDEPSSTPSGYEFLNKWTDGINTYAVGDAVEVSATKTLYPCWKVIPTENEIDFDGLPASTVEVVVTEGKNLNINEPDRTIENLTVEAGGKVSGSETVEVNNLTIKTKLGNVSGDDNTGGKSGEVLNPGSITASEVWIEIELTQDAAASAGWYAFSVPFPVDAMNGVYYGSTKLVNEKGYAIMSHHGDLRAENKYAWKKYRDILQPGVFYVITVGNTDYKTLRFKKVDGAAIFNANGVISGDDNDKMATQQYTSDVQGVTNADFNWNGLGNPYLETTQVDCGIMLFYDHGGNVFRQRQGTNVQLMVGSAFFYQADGSNITFSNDKDGSIALVPARTPKAIEETIFEVRLNDENGREADNLFLTAREDATNEYEIGRDVAKMSMGTAKCAQMWVPAYGTQLGAADFQLVNGKAEYPLVINTPKAGTYTMSTVANENADIYLTYEGSIIWNLSMGEYEIDLEKGTTNGYGLLLQAKAPQVVTGVDEVDAETGVQKIIIDEHVFILRGGQMYDVTGKMVK